jgi:hypothetical protein
VSKSFRAAALKTAPYSIMDYDEAGDSFKMEVLPTMTTHESIFAAPSRLLWAIESGFSLRIDSWRVQLRAGCYGSAATLLMLHDTYGMQWTGSISRGAAESCSIQKLRWLLDEQHCPQAVDICDFAAATGGIETLAWLKQRGCVFTASTCARAATCTDDIAVLTYLRKAGCEWDERTMTNAAAYGELELLQWLRKRGAPWDEEAVEEAAVHGHLEALIWLKNNGCACDLRDAAIDAASKDSVNVLQWLKENGEIVWDADLLSALLGVAGVDVAMKACKVS